MKKTAKYLVVSLYSVLILACSVSGKNQLLEYAQEPTLFGHYIFGHEVNSFQPCGKESDFWVKGSNEMLELMAKKYSDYAAKPYDAVFVEIVGKFESKSSDGFAMDYGGQINVEKLVSMKKKSGTDCRSESS